MTQTSSTDAPLVYENRVAVVGAGNVGATTAYALLQSEMVREIILVDTDADKAEGEAMDLSHAVPFGPPVEVRAGDYAAAAQSAIVVITAGVGGEPGESRLDLLGRNAPIVRDCVEQLKQNRFDGVLLVVTNPTDVLAQIAQQVSGLPPERVLGSGTVIDTARLRQLLGQAMHVEPRAVDAYIIGEHGDSEVAAFSCATVAGVPLHEFGRPVAPPPPYEEILRRVRQAAPEVIERKGHTAFAIASAVTRICEAVLRDEHAPLAVSTLLSGQYGGINNVYLGVPCIVGARGVERVIEMPLDESERADLHASADVVRQALAQVSDHKGM